MECIENYKSWQKNPLHEWGECLTRLLSAFSIQDSYRGILLHGTMKKIAQERENLLCFFMI